MHWWTWCDEAFAEARERGCLVLLSSGYSTCHWCHVMAHESFDDPTIAQVLNDSFVCIKLDREEHPAIDAAYMSFVQATTGSGGWPMTVWMTPDGAPLLGGTYFPPEDRGGRPGLVRVATHIADSWRDDRENAEAHANQTLQKLQAHAREIQPATSVDCTSLTVSLVADAQMSFDSMHAGFGAAPKFPRPAYLDALLQTSAAPLAHDTLREMARGGIYDQLEGGFHRYSVDREWHVPHFEKMLYDQAQLIGSYSEAARQTQEPLFLKTLEGIVTWTMQNLRDGKTGAFFAAEDADSKPAPDSPSSIEGAYWVWTGEELGEILEPRDLQIFAAHYDVRAEGNVPPSSDPHGDLVGKNVLRVVTPIPELASDFDLPEQEVSASLEHAQNLLRHHRRQRPAPHRDRKLIVAWNAMLAKSLARAGWTHDRPEWIETALEIGHAIKSVLRGAELPRLLTEGSPAGSALDYAATVAACIELSAHDSSTPWIALATQLQQEMETRFRHVGHALYESTATIAGSPVLSIIEDYDAAEPAPVNLAALNLLQLSDLTGERDFAQRAGEIISADSAFFQNPGGMPLRWLALHYRELGSPTVNIGTDPTLHAGLKSQLPSLIPIVSSTADLSICRDGVCGLPIKTAKDLGAALNPFVSLERD